MDNKSILKYKPSQKFKNTSSVLQPPPQYSEKWASSICVACVGLAYYRTYE